MSKKSNKSRRQRHRDRRRVSRAVERRGRGRSAIQRFEVTDFGSFTITPVGPGELEALHAYIEAHNRLPSSYPFDPAEQERQLTMALSMLRTQSATADAVLAAIVILGHIPDARALVALQDYAESGHVHAGIAKHAADECAGWIEDRRVATARMPSSRAMMS